MQVEYVITFLSCDTNRIAFDCFMATSAGDARRCFHECYRHGNYKILSTVLTGREW